MTKQGEKNDNSSELENPDPTGKAVKLEHVGGFLRRGPLRKAVALKNDCLCISLNKELKTGIHILSCKFEKSSQCAIGISKASHKIPYPCDTDQDPDTQSMLSYYANGYICYKKRYEGRNSSFGNEELVTMELNCKAQTLHFFDSHGEQQRLFVRGINEPVKFFIYLFYEDWSVTITSVKELSAATSKDIPDSESIEW